MNVGGPILITGGLGLVGGRVASYLREQHPDLAIRLLTRRPRPEAKWAEPFQVMVGDMLEVESVRRATEGVQTVIHLAASNEIESAQDPARALDIGGKGSLFLLQACQTAGVSRFVYMSTVRVYGVPAGQAISEETPTRPTDPYGISHHVAEEFVEMYRQTAGIHTLILRLSNGYGAPMDLGVSRWSLVFNDLCRQAATAGEVRLTSSGKPQRDFVSLRDVGRAVDHFLSMPRGAWGDGLYNLGGERSMSVMELALRIAQTYETERGKTLPISVGSGDSSHSWHPVRFSIDKLKATGFTPEHNLDDEIKRTLALCVSGR